MKIKKICVEFLNKVTIETKMTITHSIFFSSILFVLLIFAIGNTIRAYKFNIRDNLNDVVDKVAKHIESGKSIDEESILNLINNKQIKVTIIKINSKNLDFKHSLGRIPPVHQFSYENEELPFIPLNKNPKSGIEFIEIDGLRYVYIGRIINYNNEEYFIQVFKDSIEEDEFINNFYIIFIIVSVSGLISSYFINKLINRRFLKVIKNISKTTENISVNGLSQRVQVPKSEAGFTSLIVTINDMLDRLEISVIRQNQFISDISHELRTPIAVIKGYADLISRWGKDDQTILQESIDSIKGEAEHMSNLIKKLMFLSKEELELKKKNIFLNEMIDEICRDLKIINKNVYLTLDFSEDIYILGDENLIKQMIWIFIDNAIKFSNGDSPKIKISLHKEGNYSFISIKDNGRGIPEEDLLFIFDRFYRGDKSRTKEVKGTGLGLSIAKLIANKHEGEISVQSKLNEGSLFIIKLPMNLH